VTVNALAVSVDVGSPAGTDVGDAVGAGVIWTTTGAATERSATVGTATVVVVAPVFDSVVAACCTACTSVAKPELPEDAKVCEDEVAATAFVDETWASNVIATERRTSTAVEVTEHSGK